MGMSNDKTMNGALMMELSDIKRDLKAMATEIAGFGRSL